MNNFNPYSFPGIDINPGNTAHQTAILKVKEVVCNYYHMPIESLVVKTRKRTIVEPRQIAIYLIRRHYPHVSLYKIGEAFNQHHTTLINSTQIVRNLIETEIDFKQKVEEIENLL